MEALQAAPAARRRAAELGLDLARVHGTGPGGLIRLADVERTATAGAVDEAAQADAAGRLEPAFVAHLSADRAAFAALSSAFKVDLYRRHGARIGEDARIAPGAVIVAERLVLGAGCVIGADTTVEVEELVAGDLLFLGPRSRVRCRRLIAGDNAFFPEEVDVGGGGAMDPESELRVGSHGFVGERVHLNPCRGISIGDEVVISRGAVVMTHSFGGSLFEGYPVRFAPVRIEDGAQVGIGATLFPGVEMGAGSILLSGSSLVTSVPAGRLYGGVPATDQKAAARPLSAEDLRARARETVQELARQLEGRGHDASTRVLDDGRLELLVLAGGRRHRLTLADELTPRTDAADVAEEVLVALRATDDAWSALGPETVAVDIAGKRIRGVPGPLADAWREFLRKRGVRLEPRTWSYGGGWL